MTRMLFPFDRSVTKMTWFADAMPQGRKNDARSQGPSTDPVTCEPAKVWAEKFSI